MDAAYVAECLDLDPTSGRLTWRVRPEHHFKTSRSRSTWNSKYAGSEAGTRARCVSVNLGGKIHKAHRLVWLLFYGSWPEGAVDHIDGDPQNNAVANLRLATNQQNQYNRGPSRSNTSGYKGVCWDRPKARWRAQIAVGGASVFLGHYDTPEEAAAAYAEGAKKYAKEFARVA